MIVLAKLLKVGQRNKQPSNCPVDVSQHSQFTGQERTDDASTAPACFIPVHSLMERDAVARKRLGH